MTSDGRVAKKPRAPREADVRLKIALLETRRTQRQAALEMRLSEVRLSQLVNRRAEPVTLAEQATLLTYLNKTRPATLPALTAADLWTMVPEVEDEAGPRLAKGARR